MESERGKGYAFEAARALIEWGFADERVSKIKAECLKDNLPSKAILKKVGMHIVAEDEEMFFWELEGR